MHFTYSAVSDRGDIRQENQDSILCLTGSVRSQEAGLFVVADGMGGLSFGAQVSSYITSQFNRWWQEDFPQMIEAGMDREEELRELLEQEIWDINQAVFQFKEQEGCRSGSTLSALLLYDNRYQLIHMGDSRIYLFRKERLHRLTEDQSLAAQLVREKKLTENEARHSREKSILTMCVGMFERPQSFYAAGIVKKGDSFLLCSDGLYNPLREAEMEWVLKEGRDVHEKKAEILRNLIRPGFAADNVSAIVVEVEK